MRVLLLYLSLSNFDNDKFFIWFSLSPSIRFALIRVTCATVCLCFDLKNGDINFFTATEKAYFPHNINVHSWVDSAIKIWISEHPQTPRSKHWNPIEEKIRKCVRLLKFCTVSRFLFRSLDGINFRFDFFSCLFALVLSCSFSLSHTISVSFGSLVWVTIWAYNGFIIFRKNDFNKTKVICYMLCFSCTWMFCRVSNRDKNENKTENEERKMEIKSLSNEKISLSLDEKKKNLKKYIVIVLRRNIQQVGNRRVRCMYCLGGKLRVNVCWVNIQKKKKYEFIHGNTYSYLHIKCASYNFICTCCYVYANDSTPLCVWVCVYDVDSNDSERDKKKKI